MMNNMTITYVRVQARLKYLPTRTDILLSHCVATTIRTLSRRLLCDCTNRGSPTLGPSPCRCAHVVLAVGTGTSHRSYVDGASDGSPVLLPPPVVLRQP